MTNPLPARVVLGLVQMAMSDDQADNMRRAVAGVREAAAKGAKVVCLPELFLSRYFCQIEDHRFFQLAEPIPGPSTTSLGALAK
jgi:N-carbamoylputrescine amidase